jgi:hypothetical protein
MITPGLLSTALITLAVVAVAIHAEKMGELTVGVVATRLGEGEKLLGGTFEPTIQWTRQGTVSGYDYTVGECVDRPLLAMTSTARRWSNE